MSAWKECFALRRVAVLDDLVGLQGLQVVVGEGIEGVVLVDGELLAAHISSSASRFGRWAALPAAAFIWAHS